MDKNTLGLIQVISKKIIEGEHSFFVDYGIENIDHVKRIKRIANSVYRFLHNSGVNDHTCERVYDSIINHGKDLFIEEWLRPTLDKDNPFYIEDAAYQFDYYLNEY